LPAQKSLDLYIQETQASGRLKALHSLVVDSTFASCAKLTKILYPESSRMSTHRRIGAGSNMRSRFANARRNVHIFTAMDRLIFPGRGY
jgi:hypothetical protein